MLIDKFTTKAREVIEKACRLAVRKGHGHVTPLHLLGGLVEQSHTKATFSAGGADLEILGKFMEESFSHLPKAEAHLQETPINRQLESLLIEAEELAEKLAIDKKSKSISTGHICCALMENQEMVSLLEKTGASVQKLREAFQKAVSKNLQDETGDECTYLNKYAIDLTQRAQEGKLDPVIGREGEIRQMIQVLSRRLKNNPMIIGEPGVGKTALVEGLAIGIAKGEVPEDLQGQKIFSLDMGLLVAGTKFRGEFEERFKMVLQEASESADAILFIDEIHMVIGAGGVAGSMDASNLLKPALSRGEIRCIGSTTLEEYRKYFEKDKALTRRFQVVSCEEPTVEQTISILRGLKEKYEVHHGVRILDSAIITAVRLSSRYITDRFLPDKAIDLIDESAAAIRMDISSKPEEIHEMDCRIISLEIECKAIETEEGSQRRLEEVQRELEELKKTSFQMTQVWQKEKKAILKVQQAKKDLETARREMEFKIREEDFARVAELQYKIIPPLEKTFSEVGEVENLPSRFLHEEVREDDIAATLSRWTGIPISKMVESERSKILQMEELLKKRVVGQDEALSEVSKAIRRSRAGLKDPGRPIASFLLLGPTGVGKTELCKALAEFMFDDERAMVRLDMSEFMEKHSAARLVGAPPGYVGYEEGGMLTNKIKRKPYSVVLLDEVEKAHPDVFNLLLQVMDDGRLSDSQGGTVNFTNTVIMMTSNLGAVEMEREIRGFDGTGGDEYLQIKKAAMGAVKRHFRPEFINRLDDSIIFRPLSREHMKPIVKIQLDQLQTLLDERGIQLAVQDEVMDELAEIGFNPEYGARPLKRVIQRKIQNPLSEAILQEKIVEKQRVKVTMKEGKIVLIPLSEKM